MIGLTSAGSGTLIAIVLIAVFRLTPQRVVGTDIFHAAVLLWAAGHRPLGRRQHRLRPRRQHPGRLDPGRARRRPTSPSRRRKNFLRDALAVVLIASGMTLITKGDGAVVVVRQRSSR